MDFVVLLGERLLPSLLGAIRCFLIDRRTGGSRQLLRMLRENRFFLCLEQASSTRQVLETKRFCNEDSYSRLSKQETRVNLS